MRVQARLRDLRQAIQEGLDSGQPEPLEDIDTLLQMAREYQADKRKSLAS